LRQLSDDTLLVFLSDSHIGGDGGRDIFESPDDLKTLFEELAAHPAPVELVLAGDFFDFLRIAGPPEGANRASLTIERPEYREAFDALRRLGHGESRRVVYLPGNHDAEMWWNPDIRAALEREGLVHEFALSYTASFASEPARIVYCEHGNQFDSANAFHDYADPLDTPLGSHIVTDLVPHIPTGRRISALHLREVDRVFPLTLIPEWLAGRLFYDVVAVSVRWLLLPLIAVYLAIEVLALAFGADRGGERLFFALAFNVPLLIVFFGLFLLVLRWTAGRTIRSATARFGGAAGEHGGPADPAVAEIRAHLEAGRPPPLAGELSGAIAVFVSGHTHAPSLTGFDPGDGGRGVLVNSGCWLRQLQPVAARLGAPHVFVGRFVQTHVRVYRSGDEVQVELWEHPRPAAQRPPLAERIAITGRLSRAPDEDRSPRVRARAAVSGSESREV
jgi:UDP-2,3-diacylglucosamine pyrophosphatase LpxH